MRNLISGAMAFAAFAMMPLPAMAAGKVDVTFVDPESYRDVGRYSTGRSGVLKELSRYFGDLGERYLSDGQVLRIEVLNIDLAGEYEPWRLGYSDVRIMRDITPPSFKLRYTLEQHGKLLARAEERVTDMTYLWGAGSIYSSQRLSHEKKLLRSWFRRRFVRLEPPRG